MLPLHEGFLGCPHPSLELQFGGLSWLFDSHLCSCLQTPPQHASTGPCLFSSWTLEPSAVLSTVPTMVLSTVLRVPIIVLSIAPSAVLSISTQGSAHLALTVERESPHSLHSACFPDLLLFSLRFSLHPAPPDCCTHLASLNQNCFAVAVL